MDPSARQLELTLGPLVVVEVALYDRESYELLGIAAFHVSDAFFQALSRDVRRELAVVYVNVAILHSARGEKDEAMRWHQMARDVQQRLFDERRTDDVRHDLAGTTPNREAP